MYQLSLLAPAFVMLIILLYEVGGNGWKGGRQLALLDLVPAQPQDWRPCSLAAGSHQGVKACYPVISLEGLESKKGAAYTVAAPFALEEKCFWERARIPRGVSCLNPLIVSQSHRLSLQEPPFSCNNTRPHPKESWDRCVPLSCPIIPLA